MVPNKILDSSDYFTDLIRKFLYINGYDVDGPVTLVGKSGASYTLDFMIRNSKDVEFMGKHILSGSFINEEVIFKIFGISFDIGVDGVFLFTLPPLSKRAVELADFYGFKVIDVLSLKDLSDNSRIDV